MRNIITVLTLSLIIAISGCCGFGEKVRCCKLKPSSEPAIDWVYIETSEIESKEAFRGYFSKYPITNTQYAHFLNQALTTGDIVVEGSYVVGIKGKNISPEFSFQNYYILDGKGLTIAETIKGGASRIRYKNNCFKVQEGFENHPVTYVTWFGAAAFCDYYQWRLPNEQEWKAAASYGGKYKYGCGNIISPDLANYQNSFNAYGTTEVGKYGTFGYGLADMAGNVLEFTDSSPHPPIHSYHIIKGGGWNDKASFCKVETGYAFYPSILGKYDVGFRVCK